MVYSNDEISINWIENTFNNISELNVCIKTTTLDDNKYVEFLKNYVAIIRLINKKFYIVFNTTSINSNDNNLKQLLQQIKLFADVNKQLFDHYDKFLLCTSIIVSSNPVKNIINIVLNNFYKPHRPLRVINPTYNYFVWVEQCFNNCQEDNSVQNQQYLEIPC